MRSRLVLMSLGVAATVLAGGCGKGWELDYGQPAAQLLEEDVASKGAAFLGQKITVKGVVAEVDTRDPGVASIHLASGIRCNLGSLTKMAASVEPGATVYVDGFLQRSEAGEMSLDPAVLRDPTAPFSPEE